MTHVREHRSILARAEKRLLIHIATHLPRFITSDHLTALAIVAMAAAGAAFAAIQLTGWSAVIFIAALAVNWFGDSLDGTVARVRNQQRPRYGYYIDHVVDLAGTAALVAGMAASGVMTPAIAIGLLAAYCLVSAESYLATHSLGVFRISFAGVGPTELRILLAIGAIFVARDPWATVAGRQVLLFDLGGIIATAGLFLAFVASSIRNARALYVADPLPRALDNDRAGMKSGKVQSFALVALFAFAPSATAAPASATLDAWQRYAAGVEQQLDRARDAARPASRDTVTADGESIPVPSGTISHWRGSVFIHGITLDRLLHGLTNPGTPPPQADVVASRVLARDDRLVRVYIRLVRHAIVTATYDTEHEMAFTRHSPTLATARSVATRIAEVGGGDRGFLWRLHSYWRYEQQSGGVLVQLDSLTLSRSVPAIVRPVAMPLVNQIARESMLGTLEALKRYFEA